MRAIFADVSECERTSGIEAYAAFLTERDGFAGIDFDVLPDEVRRCAFVARTDGATRTGGQAWGPCAWGLPIRALRPDETSGVFRPR